LFLASRRPTSGRMTLRALLIACLAALALGATTYAYMEARYQAKLERRDRLAKDIPKTVSRPTIRISSQADIAAKRQSLTRLVWKSDVLPKGWPNLRQDRVAAPLLDGLPAAEVLHIDLPLGMDSRVYYMKQQGTECLVVYHDGHHAELRAPQILTQIWESGCSLLYLSMPLHGGNAQPTIDHPHLGTFRLFSHNLLQLVDLGHFTLLQVFFEPLVQVLNKVLAERQVDTVLMIGFSGGGWTTAVYAAIDPRIEASVHVAGSLPLFLHSVPPVSELGDVEQYYPPLLALVDYTELYVMAADHGRAQLQILNRYDPCCFAGEASSIYAPAVRSAAQKVGGHWDQWIDATHAAHQISPAAAAKVMDFIRRVRLQ
jgi:pimeloyl-ACP methyl ester carboxylesterase